MIVKESIERLDDNNLIEKRERIVDYIGHNKVRISQCEGKLEKNKKILELINEEIEKRGLKLKNLV
jgi:hypothetical protein